MNKTLYIIRGLPGSGKSTLANKLAPEASFEADQYFTNNNGEYNYDQSKIDSAHHVCQKWTECAMVIGHEDIAVANTFTQMWEMTVYFELADKHGYTVNVIECKNNFGSTHDVPEYAIDRMAERWETFDRIFQRAAKHEQANVGVSSIPICLVDVDQAGPNRNSQDDVRRGAWVSKDPIFSRQSWQPTYKYIRPQGRKHIKKQEAARPQALELLRFAWQIVKKIPGYDKANTFIYICAWYN